MKLSLLVKLICTFVCFFRQGCSQLDPDNYVAYKFNFIIFESCKGPKKQDCSKLVISNTQNMSNVIFAFDMTRECIVTKARVVFSTLKNNVTTKLLNYQLNEPCQHFVLGPLMMDTFGLKRNCKVNKGKYEAHVNMFQVSRQFLGAKFFPGTFTFKVIAFNRVHNFFCVNALLKVIPINEKQATP